MRKIRIDQRILICSVVLILSLPMHSNPNYVLDCSPTRCDAVCRLPDRRNPTLPPLRLQVPQDYTPSQPRRHQSNIFCICTSRVFNLFNVLLRYCYFYLIIYLYPIFHICVHVFQLYSLVLSIISVKVTFSVFRWTVYSFNRSVSAHLYSVPEQGFRSV
jgi:hypothetical protein